MQLALNMLLLAYRVQQLRPACYSSKQARIHLLKLVAMVIIIMQMAKTTCKDPLGSVCPQKCSKASGSPRYVQITHSDVYSVAQQWRLCRHHTE